MLPIVWYLLFLVWRDTVQGLVKLQSVQSGVVVMVVMKEKNGRPSSLDNANGKLRADMTITTATTVGGRTGEAVVTVMIGEAGIVGNTGIVTTGVTTGVKTGIAEDIVVVTVVVGVMIDVVVGVVVVGVMIDVMIDVDVTTAIHANDVVALMVIMIDSKNVSMDFRNRFKKRKRAQSQ